MESLSQPSPKSSTINPLTFDCNIGDNYAIGDEDGNGDESYDTNEIDDDAEE